MVQRVWNWWKTPLFPRAPHSPPNPTGVSQGNNIMLVASQPALQGSERKSYEIVFREVRGTGHPVSDSPPPAPLLWSPALTPTTLLLTPPSSPQSPPPVPGRQELGGGLLQKQHTEPNPLHPHMLSCPTQEFWRRPDGQPATREHLLMALADLDELLVRATFSSVPLAASISGVSLEVAQPGHSRGPPALEVEECRCPPGYVGLSCQVSVASPDSSTLAQLGQQAGQLAFDES